MTCRVFVSCGQRNDEEKQVAKDICKFLESIGFQTYLAIDVQTILDINGGIIGELKNSDCYLLVNFRRDEIVPGKYRGSLFSNQELAIAYAFGFERLLIVNQDGVQPEGMLGYIGINTEKFGSLSDCCAAVERAVDRARWKTDYSRRLHSAEMRFSDPLVYVGINTLEGRFLYLDIKNDRPDIAALEATARLAAFGKVGEPLQPSPIRSPLKATARPGFSHTIFPKSHESFDLLCVGNKVDLGSTSATLTMPLAASDAPPLPSGSVPTAVYLNCALDAPLSPLPMTAGVWTLEYEFFAIGFPILVVLIELTFAPSEVPQARIVTETFR